MQSAVQLTLTCTVQKKSSENSSENKGKNEQKKTTTTEH